MKKQLPAAVDRLILAVDHAKENAHDSERSRTTYTELHLKESFCENSVIRYLSFEAQVSSSYKKERWIWKTLRTPGTREKSYEYTTNRLGNSNLLQVEERNNQITCKELKRQPRNLTKNNSSKRKLKEPLEKISQGKKLDNSLFPKKSCINLQTQVSEGISQQKKGKEQ